MPGTPRPPPPPGLLDAILAAVAARTGVSAAEMAARGPAGDRHRRQVRLARHAFYWVAYRTGRVTHGHVAAHLGRTHNAARHGTWTMEAMREADPEVRRLTDELYATTTTFR